MEVVDDDAVSNALSEMLINPSFNSADLRVLEVRLKLGVADEVGDTIIAYKLLETIECHRGVRATPPSDRKGWLSRG